MKKISIVADYDENDEEILIDIYYDQEKNIEKINYAGVVLNKEKLDIIDSISDDFFELLKKIKSEVQDGNSN